jgi:CrcB protein
MTPSRPAPSRAGAALLACMGRRIVRLRAVLVSDDAGTHVAGLEPAPERRVSPSLDRRELAAIAVGGAIGALARVWLVTEFAASGVSWPWATFAANISGAVALGYFTTRLQERLPQSTYRRPLLGTGFCGAYTTFSTMQVEILRMLEHDRLGLAAGYALTSVAVGYLAVWLTTAAVRRTRVIV